jgi:5-methylcytosine-specific restriction protein A
MPYKSPSPCRVNGCKELTIKGYCIIHTREDNTKRRRARKVYSNDPFYQSKEWKALRTYHIETHPYCVKCWVVGVVRPAKVVDHIIPIRNAPHLRLSRDNLQSMCVPHHNQKTMNETRARVGEGV